MESKDPSVDLTRLIVIMATVFTIGLLAGTLLGLLLDGDIEQKNVATTTTVTSTITVTTLSSVVSSSICNQGFTSYNLTSIVPQLAHGTVCVKW